MIHVKIYMRLYDMVVTKIPFVTTLYDMIVTIDLN